MSVEIISLASGKTAGVDANNNLKITGPIELTFTTKYDSSHVPPTPQPKEARTGGDIIEALRPLAEMILAKLDEIRQAQNPQ